MYNTPAEFITAINKVPNGRNGFKILYGRVADIIPIKETIREIAEAVQQAEKVRRETRLARLVELNAPPVILNNERELLAKCSDFETWLKKTTIGTAFRSIWGKKGLL